MLTGAVSGQCFGRFDIVHYGHINMLKYCADRCDILCVGIATDHYCNARNIPCVRTWQDRASVIQAIKGVDFVFAYDDHDPLVLWNNRKTDAIFLNPEHRDDPVYTAVLPKLVEETKIFWIPRTPGISGDWIKGRIVEADD